MSSNSQGNQHDEDSEQSDQRMLGTSIPRHNSTELRRITTFNDGSSRRPNTGHSHQTLSSFPSGLRQRGSARSRHTDVHSQASGFAPEGTQQQNFSLAGPSPDHQNVQWSQHQPYVEPGYDELNPAYQQRGYFRPVWGLSKPLPRVIRKGMRPSASEVEDLEHIGRPKQGEENDDILQPTDSELEKGVRPTYNVHKLSDNLKGVSQEREKNFLHKFGRKLDAKKFEPPSEFGQEAHTRPFAPVQEVSRAEENGEDTDLGVPKPPVEPLNPDPEDGEEKEGSEAEERWEDEGDARRPEDEEHVPLNQSGEEIFNHHTHWYVIRTKMREPLAEALAVLIQITIGICANLAGNVAGSNSADTAAWAWGFGTMMAIYIAGGVSGGHLNPCVTIMLYIFRGFPRRKIPIYIFAQLLGAYIASLIAYGLYRNYILQYLAQNPSTGNTEVVNSFVTNLRDGVPDAAAGFLTEFVATAFIGVLVLALGDDSNALPGAGMNAFIIGLVITAETMAFAPNTGAGLNPTRDLGPRLALLTLGFDGDTLFGMKGWWVWGAWGAPLLGVLVGALLYDGAVFVGGESPVNYPRRSMKRAGGKAKKRWGRRFRGGGRRRDG